MYYYGARYYAAWTCRFISVDPLAGKYVWQSSYVHADNNPINKVDHNGEGTEGNPDKSNGSGQSSSNGGGDDKAKPTGPNKDPQGYEGKAADCDRVYHCGTYDSKGNITLAEGYYKVTDYQKNVNKDYSYNYTPSYPDPHKFSTGGQIVAGAYTAQIHNIIGLGKFGKGLITGESYGQMYNTASNAVSFVNPWSEKGDTLRNQAYSWVSNAKNWDAYDWSYGITTGALSLVGTKGAGAAGYAGVKGGVRTFVTYRLETHLAYAMENYVLTQRQTLRIGLSPNSANRFIGSQIDDLFKTRIQSDFWLKPFTNVTPRYTFGPDVYNKTFSIWWDVTTSRSWNNHLIKYNSGFGQGYGLFWLRN